MGMKVIMINGLKRSGKDFSADILVQKLEKKVQRVGRYSFADPIKEMLSSMLGISVKEFDDMKNNWYWMEFGEHTLSFRKLIQTFGNDIMKKYFGETVWTQMAIDELNFVNKDIMVIPDFRFLIEYEELKRHFDVITLKIQDTELEKSSTDPHESETELRDFKFDYVVDNTIKDPIVLEDYLCTFIKDKLGL
jgi:hypothetical protein